MSAYSPEPIRWLVTGAHGQLGSDLVDVLRAGAPETAVEHTDLTAVEHTDLRAAGRADVTAAGRAELDVTSDDVADVLRTWVKSGDGGRRLVVVNAAAWTDVDGAEADPAGAAAVNTDGPARLAAGCAEVGATLVHVSTDYVFAGTGQRPYEVDDPIAPVGVYGMTKEAGERAVRAALEAHYIVRTAWLYGVVGRNFVKTIAGLRHTRATLDVVDDQIGSPTWAAELARGLVELVEHGVPHGTYHCAGGGRASWYDLARAVFEEVGADPERVRPCDSTRFPRPAPRPAYSVLSGRSWAAAGLRMLPDWRNSLRSAFASSRSSLDTPI